MAAVITVIGKFDGDQLKNAEKALKNLGDSADHTSDRFKQFGRGLVTFGKYAATAFAAAGAAAAVGLYKAAQAAAEDEKSSKLLADQLKRTTGATQSQIDAVEKFINKTQMATGVVDDQLRPAFSNLVRATGDAEESQRLLNLSLDIAAATGRDVESVSLAIGKAANGQVSALTRLGIPLDENVKKSNNFQDALKALEGQFSGAAAGAADTFQGRLQRMNVAFDEVKEQIGYAVLPVLTDFLGVVANKVVPAVQGAVDGITGAFKEGGLSGLFDYLGGKVSEFLPILKQKLAEWGQALIDWIAPRIGPMIAKLGELLAGLANWWVTVGSPMVNEKLREWGQALVDWIQPQIRPLLGKLGDLLIQMGNWLVNTALPQLVDNLKKWGDKFVAWIGPAIPEILRGLGQLLIKVVSWVLTEGVPKLVSAAAELAVALTKWAFQLLPPILKGLGLLVLDILKAIPGLFLDLVEGFAKSALGIGKALVEGIWQGISDMGGWLWNKIKEWAGSQIPGWMKKVLGIESPSKVTAEIGKNIAQGVAVGIESGTDVVFKASKKLTDNLKDALASGSKAAVAKAKDAIKNELSTIADAAQKALDQVKDKAQEVLDYAANIRDSLSQFGSVGSIDLGMTEQPTTAQSVIQNMRNRLNTIKRFGDNLRALAALGLNQASLQEILSAGPVAGNEIASALLSEGSSAVNEVNMLESKVSRAASDLADFAASSKYGMSVGEAKNQMAMTVNMQPGSVVVNVPAGGVAGRPESREELQRIVENAVQDGWDLLARELKRGPGAGFWGA